MSYRGEISLDAAARIQPPTVVLQNRAFVELSRVISSCEPAILSNALPWIVRGAGTSSAAIFGLSHDEVVLLVAQGVPLRLRSHLEEAGQSGVPGFLARRALSHRHALIDTNVLGEAASDDARDALEEAGWQSCIAVPIRVGGVPIAVILAGTRTGAASAGTVTFLEAAANLLGAALGKPQVPPPAPLSEATTCSGCVGAVIESISVMGRELCTQHALLHHMCFRDGAPPESDTLFSRSRSLERAFRRLSDVVLRLQARGCAHGRRSASMASAVDTAVQSARPALAAARAEVEVVCAPACDFEGDAEMFAVAVRHLLVNAAESLERHQENDALPSSRRCVRVCVRHEGPCAAVHVEDSGPGIPLDLRSRIFEPSVSTKGACRGLGLTVARHVIESHGGWLELGTSDLGGARVSIYMPLRQAAPKESGLMPTVPKLSRSGAANRAERPTEPMRTALPSGRAR